MNRYLVSVALVFGCAAQAHAQVSVPLTLEKIPAAGDPQMHRRAHFDITGAEGSWVTLMARVSLAPTMDAQIRADVIAEFPFLADVAVATLADIDPLYSAAEQLVVPLTGPIGSFVAIAGGPMAAPVSDDLVRFLYQPILDISVGDVSTRRWSAEPSTWSNPLVIPGHTGLQLGQDRTAWWSSVIHDRHDSAADRTVFNFDTLLHQVLEDQASAMGADASAFINGFPSPSYSWQQGSQVRTWYSKVLTEGGLSLNIQALALRSPDLVNDDNNPANDDIKGNELDTSGLKGAADATPKLPVPTISPAILITFGGHGGNGIFPPVAHDLTQQMTVGGPATFDGSGLFGVPHVVMTDSISTMFVIPMTWTSPGTWSFDVPAQAQIGVGGYVFVKNEGQTPVPLGSHEDAQITLTDN